jgi:phosphatidylglycerophosphate synthase
MANKKSKRNWLIFNGIFLLLFVVFGLMFPTNDDFRKWLRIFMLVIFTFSFVNDLIKYKNSND